MFTFDDYKDKIYLGAYPRPGLLDAPARAAAAERLAEILAAEPNAQSIEGAARERVYAALCVRDARPLPQEATTLLDGLLWSEAIERGITDVNTLKYKDGVAVHLGDIRRLNADAIVNAANSALLGCFVPGHGCIDNRIHAAAGPQMRADCAAIMRLQAHGEYTGSAKVTCAYNLPARYVLHTVGPIVEGEPSARQTRQLADCYTACLDLAERMRLQTVAFCCVATGLYGFPPAPAAHAAVRAVRGWLREHRYIHVIFDCFRESDYRLYLKESEI